MFDTFDTQVALFACSFFASTLIFVRWYRLSRELKSKMWELLGWFSALTSVNSLVGIVVWTLFMQNNINSLSFGKPGYRSVNGLFYSTYSEYHKGIAIRFILYGFEVLCVCLAVLLTLNRVMEHVISGMQRDVEKFSSSGQRGFWYVLCCSKLQCCNA